MRMKSRFIGKGVLVGLAVVALVLSFACGKKGGAAKAIDAAKEAAEAVTGSAAPVSSAAAANDYMKPYLTDEKVSKFVESLQEDVNPFEVIFKGGQKMDFRDMEKRASEYNGFAQKYGFKDFADYMAVWGRIMVGDMTIASEKMSADMVKGMEDTIRNAEEQLQKPDLNAEMRKIYEEQIVDAKKTIEEWQKPDEKPSLNADDLALVAKYKAQLDEAMKKKQDK
jgi:hypothetical protein